MNIEEKFKLWLSKQKSKTTGKLLASTAINSYAKIAYKFMEKSPEVNMCINLYEITDVESLRTLKKKIVDIMGERNYKIAYSYWYSNTYNHYESFLVDGMNPYSDFIKFTSSLRDIWFSEDEVARKSRNDFAKEYTIEKLKSMTLEEYALGHEDFKSSLCYKVERGIYSNNGSVRGGTAAKFGIYKSANGDWKNEKSQTITNPEEYFLEIKSRLVYFVESLDTLDTKYDEFKDEKQKAFKSKIAYLLRPDLYVRVYSEGVLKKLAKYFDVDDKYIDNYCSVVLNREVAKRVYSIDCGFVDESMKSTLLWDFYVEVLNADPIEIIEDIEEDIPEVEENIKDTLFVNNEFMDKFYNLLRRKQNIILQGPPGTGKTHIAEKLVRLGINDGRESIVQVVQFHQSYSYEEFIEGYRPNGSNGFELKSGIFRNFIKIADENKDKDYILLIDEINRANLSKVFGELMMLIESDKRNKTVTLPYSNEEFKIPKNVFIVGTMNTADRSISMVDYALRRRFAFIDLDPQFYADGVPNNKLLAELIDNKNISRENALLICDNFYNLNEFITKNLGKGFTVGHSYFITDYEEEFSDTYNEIIEYEVKPLLEEYFFDDQDKVEEALRIIKLNE